MASLCNLATQCRLLRKGGRKRRPNGSGTIVKLSGNRKNPFQVRVNTRLDDRGYPIFDILGNFPDTVTAGIALAEYNKDPYDPKNRKKLFSEVFAAWYKWKYKTSVNSQEKKNSSQYCTLAAYKKCVSIQNMIFADIRPVDLQEILENSELSHAMLEHVKNLFNQMYKYAMQFEIVEKNYATFTAITKEDDTESGVPFTENELSLLWQNVNKPFVDTVLIYCYSGWRINELAKMPLNSIDLENKIFKGGLKTRFSRNRIVPIHSRIYDLVRKRYNSQFKSLIYHDMEQNIYEIKYRAYFAAWLIVY